MGRVSGPLAASPVLLRNVSFPNYGKSHGTPAIDSRGRVFAVFWLQGAGKVLFRRWDVDASVFDVMLPTFGSDIIEDSNDALLLSDAGVAYITFSYYSPSTCSNCTSIFAVRCDDGAILWSFNYHTFVDAMAMYKTALVVLSSQSRRLLMYSTLFRNCVILPLSQLSHLASFATVTSCYICSTLCDTLRMYDAATGKLLASSSIYDSISDRSAMAVSDDGSVAIVQERDDTFGHNKIAAYRCPLTPCVTLASSL